MAFQSPATSYAEKRIDFTNLVSLSPTSTYVWECTSDYPEHGILRGSLLAVEIVSRSVVYEDFARTGV